MSGWLGENESGTYRGAAGIAGTNAHVVLSECSARDALASEERITQDYLLELWQRLAPGGGLVIDIPSSHEGMFRKPYVDRLAQALKGCIDRASGEMQDFQTSDFQSRLSANLLYLLFLFIGIPLIM